MNQDRGQRSRLVVFLTRLASLAMPVFFIFQIFRVVSLVFFAIFAVDCILWDGKTSVDCDNFTTYKLPGCGGYCWKTAWLYCSIISSFLMLFSLCKRFVPEIRPEKNAKVFKILLKQPYFWSLSFLLALVVAYDALIIYQNENARIHIEVLVIISKMFTLVLVFQLNFTLPPSVARGFRVITVASYYFALAMFAMDNLCKAITTSAQVAFKIYTVDKSTAAHPLTIVNLMLMVGNAALYNDFLQFFWHKIFCGQKDILTISRKDLAENIEEIMEEEPGNA